ncbi:leucine carboxy methyltransferase [Pichia kluyveri]|uniref:Leucine carboxyl methyltransferase 1 n=1 Tax=Pichia kluyveri TaxID=36015 RepID=A0AAV5R8U1_PICKL|nr:leucine carboxy methyltransferase [Pichia kluyveri]
MDSSEDAIQQTDYDALSSRLSCHMKKYFNDEYSLNLIPLLLYYNLLSIENTFLRNSLRRKLKSTFFDLFQLSHININTILNTNNESYFKKINKFSPLKSPMINRGTYLRTMSINEKINDFIKTNEKANKIQIISLGAGNDTRPFQLIPQYGNLTYFELDMEQTTRLKSLAIQSSPILSKQVGINLLKIEDLPTTSNDVLSFNPELSTPNYKLIPFDLKQIKSNMKLSDFQQFQQIDPDVPTLIISECCICYLSVDDADNLLHFWKNNIVTNPSSEFLIYEPIGGSTTNNLNYGKVMVNNLNSRGLKMPSLMVYNSVELQIERFKKIFENYNNGNFSIWCNDMKWVYENSITCEENKRLTSLEWLDEIEEFNLINSHYCLIVVKWKK